MSTACCNHLFGYVDLEIEIQPGKEISSLQRDILSTISQKCIFGLGKQANSATKFEQEDGSQCLGATTQIQIAKSTLVLGVNCLQNLQIAFERFQQLEGGLSSQVENLNVFEVAPWSVKKVKNPLHRNSTGI